MTEMMIRGREVTRPTPDALKSTILDHATVVDLSDSEGFGYRNNAGLWPTYNCLDTLVPYPTCQDVNADPGFKSFATVPWVPAFEFAVYGGSECHAVGLDRADQLSETERVFARNEAKGVERALAENRFNDPRVIDTGSDVRPNPYQAEWDEAVDLGTTSTLSSGIAALEGYAAANYAGVPTLHLPRAAVVLGFGCGLITEIDGKFYTKTGAKVAAGGGYDSQFPSNGLLTMYATGEVYVERSTTFSRQEIVVPGDGSGRGSDENGLGDNTVISLVERLYRVGVDCFVARVASNAFTVTGLSDSDGL